MNNHCTAFGRKLNARARAGLALLPLLAANLVFAQATTSPAAPDAAGQDNVLKLDKFEVTGSYIPVAGSATAIPVATITSQSIEATGINTNLLDVLRKTMPQFSGNSNIGSTNANISSGNTGGGAQVAFRNVQTLVLINGRRAAYAPVLASGGFQYVDVNLIPISAVERIEVLQDGASAIYGSDAVSGVVNIILKNDYRGVEVGARYGFSDNKGNYAERKAWVVGGAGNETTTMTVSAEWTKTDPLFQYERDHANPIYGTGTFAGVIAVGSQTYVLNPTLNRPANTTPLPIATLVANGTYIPVDSTNLALGLGTEGQYSFNLAQFVTLLLGMERQSATVAIDHKVNDSITVFGDILYSKTRTFSQLNAQPISATLAAGNANSAVAEQVSVRNRFTSNPRQYFYDSTSIRGVAGIKGEIAGSWKWEVAATKNIVNQDYINKNLVNSSLRVAAVGAGLIDLFARQQAPGAIDAAGFFGTAIGTAESTLTTYDARISGEAFQLPGGAVGIAVGADARTETLTQTADVNSQSNTFGWDSATTLDPFDASRKIVGAFAEVRVPIFGPEQGIRGAHLLELDVAVRHEDYNDTDDPTVPKYSVRYLPFDDQLAFRGTYSKSFAAPTLFNLFGPGGIGFTENLSLDKLGGGLIGSQANLRGGANPDLKPSRSTNWTAGVVYSPKALKGFSVSLDYFHIKQTDLVSTIGESTILQDVEFNGPASPYAQFVRIAPPQSGLAGFTGGAPITAPGQIGSLPIDTIYVTDTLVNIASQELSGFDLKTEYTWNTDTWGRFNASVSAGYYESFAVTFLPGDAPFETAGRATTTNGTIPRWTSYTFVGWQRGPYAASVGFQYVPSVKDEGWYDATDSGADEHVESFSSFDLSGSYTFGNGSRYLKGLTLTIGVNNVFNEPPPIAKGTFADSNTDSATYGDVGRFMYVEAKYKF